MKKSILIPLGVFWFHISQLNAQPSSFSYQGRLSDGGVAAQGTYDLQFNLYAQTEGGTSVGDPIILAPVTVVNGVFSVTLDFGKDVFDGQERWLEISVRSHGDTDPHTILAPRQAITSTPYAIRAESARVADTAANVSGPVPAAQITGLLPLGSVPNLDADKVVSGILAPERIPGLDASRIVAGLFDPQRIPDLDVGKITGMLPASRVGAGTITGAVAFDNAANSFAGDGGGLTGLDASQLTTGIVGDARLASNIPRLDAGQTFSGANNFENAGNTFTGDGGGLRGLNASQLTSGTLSDIRLSANVARLDATQTFNSANSFSHAGNQFTGSYAGDGGGLTGLNATGVTVGTLDDARLSSNVARLDAGQMFSGINVFGNTDNEFTGVFRGDGSGLTGLNVSGATAGTLDDARLSVNVARLDAGQTFSAANVFGNPGNQFTGTFSGNGGGLTGLNASQLTAGTVNDARLSGNVARLDAGQTFSGASVFGNPGNQFSGSFSGNGGGLTGLNASQLTGGTVNDARLSANVARLNASQTFTAANTFNHTGNRFTGSFTGNGGGLSGLTASQLTGAIPATVMEASLLRGMTVASLLPNDPGLTAGGFHRIYSIPESAWSNGSTVDALTPRHGHSAVWTGSEFILWGGTLVAGVYTATGSKYRPETDAWTVLSPFGAPSPRSGHGAIWTGSEMVIWGGFGGGGDLATGARFQPDDQLWKTVASVDAPAARSGHVTVWNSSRMVVWGGRNGDGFLNDGALYDPATDQWLAIAPVGAPEARHGAKGALAWSRLVVWGGENQEGELATGGILRFVGSTITLWSSMTTIDAPQARKGHNMISTGEKIIVWGGSNSGVPLNTGGIFDPIANTWTPTGTIGAPAARTGHVAVWTGQEMLIFGGVTAQGTTASGAAYDPATDQWRALSSMGNPTPRAEGGAVWTGSEILLFGGRAGAQSIGSLQRLSPQPAWHLYRKL